jgi:steroid delta-isomerase-like uncharacterized protein
MSEINRAIVRRVVEEVWNRFDLKLVDELYSPDCVCRYSGEVEFRGRDGYKELVTRYRSAFPDLHGIVDRVIAEGESAAMRWITEGTHRRELEIDGRGVPASGAKVRVTGLTAFLFKDGKIAEEMIRPDDVTFRRQLGLLPDVAAVAFQEKLCRDMIEEFWNKGRSDLAEEFFAPDFIQYGPQHTMHRGIEGLKQLLSAVIAAFPDRHYVIENLVCQREQAAIRWSLRGTHRGEWLGVEASNKPVMAFGTTVLRTLNGKFVEGWAYWDVLDALHQMGAAREVQLVTRM